MTTSTSLSTFDADDRVDPGPSRFRSFKRFGIASLAATLLLGSGVAVGTHVSARSEERPTMAPALFVAIKGHRAFDSRVDFPVDKIDDLLTVAINGRGEVLIPPEAVAVAYTVTATATEGTGFAYVDTYDGTDGSQISTVAWTEPGQRVVNSGIVQTFDGSIDGGTRGAPLILVGVGGTDASAHIIIDITGYLVPAS